jgi:hypothetical protein
MAQASAIAAWLMLIFKAAVGLMIFLITVLCLLWTIRSFKASQRKGAYRE